MADVIQAFPASTELPDNPMEIAPRLPGWCSHDEVLLDQHDRIVSCRKCSAVLEPFDFLLGNATTIQRAWSAYREVNRKAAEVQERLTALKKEEQRLRAMVKRLQDKTGSVLSVRNPGSTL